jgi:EAL domain-containing protein (putative c-di-GMP-specific phosphodiesterase class I)
MPDTARSPVRRPIESFVTLFIVSLAFLLAPSLTRALEIELTESSILIDCGKTVSVLRRFKDMKIRIALDDFGTGYSTLEYLWDFPFDTLKINRIFAANIDANPTAAALTASIIRMGHALGPHVVAEGIKTEGQMAFFRDQGCD